MKEPGVLMYQGRIICYDCSGDWIHAVELGDSAPLPITPDLSRAIHEDLARGRRKAAEFHDECLASGESRQREGARPAVLPLEALARFESPNTLRYANRHLLRRRA